MMLLLMYRFDHHIIGNHTSVWCEPWVTCLLGCVTECDMSRVAQCHERLETLGDNTWPWPETTDPILSHCSHPQPCSAAVRCCIQITSEKSHLIENSKFLIIIRERSSQQRVRGEGNQTRVDRDKPRNFEFGRWFMDCGWLRVTNWITHYHKDFLKISLVIRF